MLVLSRKVGEHIEIGDDITIVIKGLRKGRVQVGIDAPREVRVVRGASERIDDHATDDFPIKASAVT